MIQKISFGNIIRVNAPRDVTLQVLKMKDTPKFDLRIGDENIEPVANFDNDSSLIFTDKHAEMYLKSFNYAREITHNAYKHSRPYGNSDNAIINAAWKAHRDFAWRMINSCGINGTMNVEYSKSGIEIEIKHVDFNV